MKFNGRQDYHLPLPYHYFLGSNSMVMVTVLWYPYGHIIQSWLTALVLASAHVVAVY
jgi:hypothetical protein